MVVQALFSIFLLTDGYFFQWWTFPSRSSAKASRSFPLGLRRPPPLPRCPPHASARPPLCSPPLSPSSCLVFMAGECPWRAAAGSRSHALTGRKGHHDENAQTLLKRLPPKLWRAHDPPATFVSIQFPPEEKKWQKIKKQEKDSERRRLGKNPKPKGSADRKRKVEGVCDLKPKQWHPLCISSYLKMTRLHFCGIQYVMSWSICTLL